MYPTPVRFLAARLLACSTVFAVALPGFSAPESTPTLPATTAVLTPAAPASPRINGARVFGVHPGSPFLFTIPATGDRPMTFAATGLPAGLSLDSATGRITGVVAAAGEFTSTLKATNALGSDEKPLKILVGEQIALTPPMGWNSWNCWAGSVTQDKVLAAAKAMVSSGLINHGWTYVNIDDTWQGARSGPTKALQSNPEKFPDMQALATQIHGLGLKAGLYSTPWVTSYATRAGGSAETADGAWSAPKIEKKGNLNKKIMPWAIGRYHFMKADADQWAAWGFDYLKYDWNPIEAPDVKEMGDALRASGRDIIYSLSNHASIDGAADWAKLSNAWRTTGDIRDTWKSMSSIGFSQDPWQSFAGPGHWNDPDMLVVGVVGWGPKLHPTSLTPDEQYTHISLWCLLSAPLLIGADMDRLDPFTLSLLTNDEVLALDQDSLGRGATRVVHAGNLQIWEKPLADGSVAVGFFNLGDMPATVTASWSELGLNGSQIVRDLWRQRDVGTYQNAFSVSVASHGVFLFRAHAAK